MILFVLVMFIISLICLILGTLINLGHTDLIHEYHRKNVKDFAGYGKAIGMSIIGLSVIHLISGCIALLWPTDTGVVFSVIFYIIAFIIFLISIIKIQKKYNGKFIS